MRIHLASLARDIAIAVLAIAGACHIDLAAAPPDARDVDVAAARVVLDNPRGAP